MDRKGTEKKKKLISTKKKKRKEKGLISLEMRDRKPCLLWQCWAS